jgi:hypothetical protein
VPLASRRAQDAPVDAEIVSCLVVGASGFTAGVFGPAGATVAATRTTSSTASAGRAMRAAPARPEYCVPLPGTFTAPAYYRGS